MDNTRLRKVNYYGVSAQQINFNYILRFTTKRELFKVGTDHP